MSLPSRIERPHVLVVGSRGYPDLLQVRSFVDDLPSNTVVVSGGAQGVDRVAATAARKRGLAVLELSAPWSCDSKRAGFIRNCWLLELLPPNQQVRAFWDGSSPGTRMMIRIAKGRGDLDVRVRKLVLQ